MIALAFALIAYSYHATLAAMTEIWWRSETYAHGLVVPIISAWLIWRSRHRISQLTPQVWMWPLIPLGITVFVWWLGELTAVNALTQFSIVAIIVFCCMALLGKAVSKELAFPLLFLFFAVPIGDFLMPRLMEWTADFTVIAVRLSGIPVYREGQNFVIPSGNWSVVEACSGIRYLIASLTVGTLYAYLTYISLKRRLVFIAVSVLVPIIANWLRAYLIVMLGHLSGNKLASGVDHLIYGWVFFGVVIAIMFAIGMRWSETDIHENSPAVPLASPSIAHRNSHLLLSTIVVACFVAAGPLAKEWLHRSISTNTPVLVTPQGIGPWQNAARFVDLQPQFSNSSAEFHEAFVSGSDQVGLYIAYYRNQDFDRKLITSTNVLVTTSNPAWQVASTGSLDIETDLLPHHARVFELIHKQSVTDDHFIAWQWYWINGHLTSSDIEAKLLTAWAILTGHGDDSAVIVIYAPKANAERALAAFGKDMMDSVYISLAGARQQ